MLYDETDRYGGRILSIVLTPYLAGMHYRIKYLNEMFDWLLGHDGVWNATGAEILAAFNDN